MIRYSDNDDDEHPGSGDQLTPAQTRQHPAASAVDGNTTEDCNQPSKSERKRQAREITRLGQQISELPAADLQTLPLDDQLSQAVAELRKIRSFGARKRQLHYLGKLLRNSDLEAIRVALRAIELTAATETRLLHSAESWRDRLLGEGDSALQEFLQQYPDADRQRLRQMIRNHHREQQTAQSGGGNRSAREVFRLVRTVLQHAAAS